GDHNIVVDLSRVSYISSGGWGIVVGEVKRLRERGGDVVLVGMMPEVYDVYELLGFADILKALPDLGAARGFFRKTPVERVAETSRPAARTAAVPEDAETLRPFSGIGKTGAYEAEWDSLKIEAGTVGEQGDVAVLSLAGIVDTVSAENLRQAIDRVIKAGIHKIVVDMSLVEYVSSGGWGTFTERLREVRRKGGDLKVFGMDPDVYYVFTMLGFNIVLSSFDILTEAIEDFKRVAGEKPSRHPSSRAAVVSEPAPPEQSAPGDIGADATPVIPSPDAAGRSIDTTSPSARPAEPGVKTEKPGLEAEKPALKPERHAETQKPAREPAPVRAADARVAGAVRRADEWARWTESDGVLFGEIEGSIEAVAVEKLDGEMEARLESKPVFVLLDLGGVDYISSTGWGLIAKYREEVRRWGGSMTLCRMRPELYEIFALLELTAIIEVYATVEEALAAFRDSGGRTAMRRSEKDDRAPAPAADLGAVGEAPVAAGAGGAGEESGLDEILAQSPRPVETDRTESAAGKEYIPAGATGDRLASTWRTEDLDILDDTEDLDAQSGSGSGGPEDAEAVGGSQRLDAGSSVGEERLAEDKKIRDLGWAQYGEKLREKRKKSGSKRDDEGQS
ncbi:MAG: anti-anti-sigma factor, partial [Candidatus Krumholzibacteriota bacterium]|nr:anti-anti-sigma factor [Candidatus Krumholzibacteriota bacterium]